ncbi:hypothetical protein [Hymenobacter elongatus]|uniref:Uncharacterized protein n=1 Tax=Hymenobacter elongatus TaxID=877208 RepID=A0A4Z0PE55_9BACT|nr:hypothetical protein [Hymenobacter elongatus]TGE11799.1 hypothetical protein E5J99_20725 [Hymenobacter elongatus]
MSGTERLQVSYKSWAAIVPENFRTINENLEVIKINCPSAEEVNKYVKEKMNNQLFDALYLIYPILSQQAHVSVFSKGMIYDGVDGQVKIFYTIARAILECSIMLLDKIEMGNHQQISSEVKAIRDSFFTE